MRKSVFEEVNRKCPLPW